MREYKGTITPCPVCGDKKCGLVNDKDKAYFYILCLACTCKSPRYPTAQQAVDMWNGKLTTGGVENET